jgi:hypothetical protein
MLCAYYKPIKCVYLRLCHIVLILQIIFLLCDMFAQTSFNLPNCFIALVLDLVCEIHSW